MFGVISVNMESTEEKIVRIEAPPKRKRGRPRKEPDENVYDQSTKAERERDLKNPIFIKMRYLHSLPLAYHVDVPIGDERWNKIMEVSNSYFSERTFKKEKKGKNKSDLY